MIFSCDVEYISHLINKSRVEFILLSAYISQEVDLQ